MNLFRGWAHHVVGALTLVGLVGCEAPAPVSDPETEEPSIREATVAASNDTRAELGVEQWRLHEEDGDAPTWIVEGLNADGKRLAAAGVYWSADADGYAATVHVNEAVVHLHQTVNGDVTSDSEDVMQRIPRARATAARVIADLGAAPPSSGVTTQTLKPLNGFGAGAVETCIVANCGQDNPTLVKQPPPPPQHTSNAVDCLRLPESDPRYQECFAAVLGVAKANQSMHPPAPHGILPP